MILGSNVTCKLIFFDTNPLVTHTDIEITLLSYVSLIVNELVQSLSIRDIRAIVYHVISVVHKQLTALRHHL